MDTWPLFASGCVLLMACYVGYNPMEIIMLGTRLPMFL
jgi:hypothetical protein